MLVEQGPVAQLLTNPQHPYTHKLLTASLSGPCCLPTHRPSRWCRRRELRVGYPVPLPGLKGWFKKGEFVAVQGADVCLRQGQTLGVVGESGSGKSTLAQAILGLLPSQGALQIAGKGWQQPSHAQHASQPGAAPSGAGGVSRPVFLAVAAHDGGRDRWRRPARACAGHQRSRAARAGAVGAAERGAERGAISRLAAALSA